MTQAELDDIESVIERKIRKIAGNSGYGYLDCFSGEWKDGGEYVHNISEMSVTHLRRCLKTVKNSSTVVDSRFEYVNEIIEIDEENLTEDDKDKILSIAKEHLYDLHYEKIKEIENELESR